MPLYKMTLAYDGTGYQGWQVQPGADTIQGRLELALSRMAQSEVRVVGSGRTDAGVHALAQVAHFELPKAIPPEGVLRGLNAMLPPDIRIRAVGEAEQGFHARYRARCKTYRYHLDLSPVASPFRCRFALHHPYRLDRGALDRAAAAFVGEHDFAAFRAASCVAKTTRRKCEASRFLDEDGELVYQISANGFLQHMARNIVGTLLEIGRGKISPSAIEDIIASGDRAEAGPTAPAKGLHLIRVDYAP